MLDFAKRTVEPVDLKDPRLEELLNLGLGNGGKIVKLGIVQLRHLLTFDHPTVTDKEDALALKIFYCFGDLARPRIKITRLADEDFDGDRIALFIAQQPHHHLFLAGFLVAIIAPVGQGMVEAFDITAGDIV